MIDGSSASQSKYAFLCALPLVGRDCKADRRGSRVAVLCWTLLLWWLMGFAHAFVSPIAAQEVDADDALRSIGSPVWYDRSNDSYAPPRIQKLQDNPIRTGGRRAKYVPETRWSFWDWFDGNNSGQRWNWGLTGFSSDFFSAMVLTLLGILLATILTLLAVHSLRNYMPGYFERKTTKTKIEIDPAKVVDLPFEVERTTYENPLQEAEALMNAGKFREAIIFLYGYQLLALDQERRIFLERGKTNRMYLRELDGVPRLRDILQKTMLVFEDAYFGHYPVGEEPFRECWSLLPEFHQLAIRNAATPDRGREAVEVQPA